VNKTRRRQDKKTRRPQGNKTVTQHVRRQEDKERTRQEGNKTRKQDDKKATRQSFSYINETFCIADVANLRLNATSSDTLADLCDGARYTRIQATLPIGTSALTSILFFDEIQRDEKGFVSGEGIIIVGGF
jgi:hypothetical protein